MGNGDLLSIIEEHGDELADSFVRSNSRAKKPSKSAVRGVVEAYLRHKSALHWDGAKLARPLKHVEAFFRSRKTVRIVTGSNQSSKTFHAELEAARALRGIDPYGKYPRRDGRCMIVGLDGDHLADPLYKKLFEPGEFKVIRDEKTRLWRAVRPDPEDPNRLDPYDVDHRDEWRDAPPLIPQSMIKEQAFVEAKTRRIPRVTILKNGWRILWRSSKSSPPQGVQYDMILADEELEQCQKWIPEMIPRLVKRGGRLIWPATAQEGGLELQDLLDKAEDGCDFIDVWTLLIDDNPFVEELEKRMMREVLSEEELAVRYHGQSARSGRKIYPGYAPMTTHGCEPFPIDPTWTKIGIIDPGRRFPTFLAGAVDPDERHAWVFGGVILRQANASMLAAEVFHRWPNMGWDVLIIDMRAGRQHLMDDTTDSVAVQYWNAFKNNGVKPRMMGPCGGFYAGSEDTRAREEAVQNWMAIREDGPFAGTPTLQVMRGVFPELDRQIKNVQTRKAAPNKRDTGMRQDAVVCLEYWAAHGAHFLGIKPRRVEPVKTNIVDRLADYRSGVALVGRRRRSSRASSSQPGLIVE